MRNRPANRRFVLRHLAPILALASLAVGVQPGAAGAAVATTATEQIASAPAATWSLIATLDPAHVQAPRSVLTLYGVYAFTPILVNFNPRVLDPSINQSAVPMYSVPDDGRSHTYKVVFHLTTDVTTTTSYKLNDRTPVTVAGGDADLEFIETIQLANWHAWALRNTNNDHWLFYSAKIYEQTS